MRTLIHKAEKIPLSSAIITGVLLGGLGIFLAIMGNPENSGICISCFLENIAGSLHLHQNARMSYLRPEIIGLVIGSFLMALMSGRFRVRGGSSALIRFLMGFFLMVGAAMFIGCPVKSVLRLSAGDLTAAPAILGFVAGVWFGLQYLRGGFALEREQEIGKVNGLVMPVFFSILLLFILIKPAFIVLGAKGPAAMHAPLWISLLAGILIGGFAQRSTFCMMAGFRNFFIARNGFLLKGILAMFLTALGLALLTGHFRLGINGQPGSHLAHGWSFLGMFLVGGISVLANGCPFRQVIMAGEGNTDAGLTLLGMLIGGGIVQSWEIRATIAGATFAGKVAVLTGLVFLLAVGIAFRTRKIKARKISVAQEEQWEVPEEYQRKHYRSSGM
ncbi:MAG: YedE family putative selenium transporter [bacterium]